MFFMVCFMGGGWWSVFFLVITKSYTRYNLWDTWYKTIFAFLISCKISAYRMSSFGEKSSKTLDKEERRKYKHVNIYSKQNLNYLIKKSLFMYLFITKKITEQLKIQTRLFFHFQVSLESSIFRINFHISYYFHFFIFVLHELKFVLLLA